jgi:hypothetical protein
MAGRLVWAAVIAGLLAGCGSKPEDAAALALEPSQGTVTRGDQAVGPNAQVMFTPESGQDISVTALTDAQGHFELATSGRDGKRKPGVPAGKYTVTVVMPLEAGQGNPEQVKLTTLYEVKPGPNDFKLALPPKR